MQAVDIMQTEMVTVSPADTVAHAARLMLDHKISGLPVVDDGGRVVGIVTEGDLMHRVENDTDSNPPLIKLIFSSPERLAADFVKSTGKQVKDVMTRNVVTVAEAALLAEIADHFGRNHIKRVPVVRDGKLIGIVTRADLMRALIGSGGARPGDLRTVEFG